MSNSKDYCMASQAGHGGSIPLTCFSYLLGICRK